jgi:hypothetical protein
MHPSTARLARILPRAEATTGRIFSLPPAGTPRPPTLMEQLLARRRAGAGAGPANIRLEPTYTKKDFARLPKKAASTLRRVTRREW